MKINLYFVLIIGLSFFDLKSQNNNLFFTLDKDKFKIGSSLSLSSQNQTDKYNISIYDPNGQLIIERDHKFTDELVIDLDEQFIAGNYTIEYNILNTLSSDLPFTIKKKGISVGVLVGIIGGIGGVAAIIVSSSSSGKTNPPLPEPPLPGGG